MGAHGRSGSTVVDEITTASVVDECLRAWGPDLFSYLLGAGAHVPLAEWRLDTALTERTNRARLHVAHELPRLFESGPAARAWVRRRNPELADRPPADVIRCGTEDELFRVRDLAERQVQKG